MPEIIFSNLNNIVRTFPMRSDIRSSTHLSCGCDRSLSLQEHEIQDEWLVFHVQRPNSLALIKEGPAKF